MSCQPYACNAEGTACAGSCTQFAGCADCAVCFGVDCFALVPPLAVCVGRCSRDVFDFVEVDYCGQSSVCPLCSDCTLLGCDASGREVASGVDYRETGQAVPSCTGPADCDFGFFCKVTEQACRAVCLG